jgi:acyl-CoA reductase-like NAD-dependent aldehyde dehydrogenase
MSPLLEKALEKVGVLPQAEQDAIASQILASLADEEAWRRRFAEKRDIIRRLAREALEEDARGETLPLDDLLGDSPGGSPTI